ncbi:MAG: C4-dicarboxylate ABC transporter [Firmicutes bacterium HGW-Firmicutes-7]|nr:MAG: C4-dicarboxylate ABC transporter [Firmicutes bacterium HGW-Firmicutes-7]
MKKMIGLLLILAMTLSVISGCTQKIETENKAEVNQPDTKVKKGEYVLSVGTVLTDKDPLYAGLQLFQKNVSERTNGAVEIKLFPSAQLGSDEDLLEQAKVGTGVGVVTDPGRLSSYITDFGILGAPYLVDNYEDALRLLDTSVFKGLSDEFSKDGLKILSFNYFQGTRHLFTNKPITKPEDLKGQRIRSSGSDIVTATIKNMGANPSVLPWSEAYSGLQQKVVDGVEVHYSAAVGSSIFEVTKYLSKTAHFQLLTGLVISNDWFNKLPAEYQTILMEEAYNGGKYASEQVIEKEKEFENTLVDNGIEIVDCDVEALKAAVEPAFDELGYRELKDKIDIELGKK